MSETGGIGHTRRLQAWDYERGASFFITLTLEERRPVFGQVASMGEMRLSPLGQEVLAALEAIPRLNPGITLHGHVVMPDHVHLNVHVAAGLQEPLKTLGEAIRRFKHYTAKLAANVHGATPCTSTLGAENKRGVAPRSAESAQVEVRGVAPRTAEGAQVEVRGVAPRTFWQKGYHDHLCLSRRFIESTERYIAYNPQKWWLMHSAKGALRVQEPLFSPRLANDAYWKGVGNIGLLEPAQPMVSLRVSRDIATPEALEAVVKRMERAVAKGYVVISGFISQGERSVLEMLRHTPSAHFIRILPSCIPNRPFRPESAFVQAFAEGRCLHIAQGNDETEFGRAACLDLNDEIVKIATSGNGLALYFKKEGLLRWDAAGTRWASVHGAANVHGATPCTSTIGAENKRGVAPRTAEGAQVEVRGVAPRTVEGAQVEVRGVAPRTHQ